MFDWMSAGEQDAGTCLPIATWRRILVGLLCLAWTPAVAQQPAPAVAQQPDSTRWMVNVYASGVFFPNTGGEVFLNGAQVPGASLSKPADATATFDIGCFVLPDLAIDLYAGIPPKGAIDGTGPIKSLGTLATTWYGPAILGLQYYLPGFGAFHPFIGGGVNYTIFLGTRGRALDNVKVPDNFGYAFETGLKYDLTPRWTLNLDIKYVQLTDRISAFLSTPAGKLPAVAKADINPFIFGVGVGYKF